jgi:peptidoglycan/LPS O-acetylase OafA/YrhL
MGAALGLAMHQRAGFALLQRVVQPLVAGVLGAFVLLFGVLEPLEGRSFYLVPLGVALLLPSLLAGVGWPARLLSSNWLRWVGRISFGVYLLHQLALFAAEKAVPGASAASDNVAGILGVTATMIAAPLSFRWFEEPINQAARRWSAKRRAQAQPA